MSAQAEEFTYWQEQYKVDLPPGQSGDVSIRPIEIDTETSFKASLMSLIYGERGAIPPGTFTGLYRGDRLWMSDTPDEIRDQYPAVQAAEFFGGRVLVNGLGLGMFVKAALAMPNVEHVDVVEIDPDVVKLVGPHYESERCTIHLGDAYTMRWPRDRTWSVVWSDIWPTIDDRNLTEMRRLRRKYKDRSTMHLFWAYAECLQMAKQRAAAKRAGMLEEP